MLSPVESSRLHAFRKQRVRQKIVNQSNRTDQIEEEMNHWKKRLTSSTPGPERERFVDTLIKLRAEQTKLLLETIHENNGTSFETKRVIRAYYADCARLVGSAAILR